jgi:hypothetical protein
MPQGIQFVTRLYSMYCDPGLHIAGLQAYLVIVSYSDGCQEFRRLGVGGAVVAWASGRSCHAAPRHERQHLVFAAGHDFAFPPAPHENLPGPTLILNDFRSRISSAIRSKAPRARAALHHRFCTSADAAFGQRVDLFFTAVSSLELSHWVDI